MLLLTVVSCSMMCAFNFTKKQPTNEDDAEEDSESDNDDSPAALQKDKQSEIYQPPRMQAMPFDIVNERAHEKEERQRRKQLDRMQRSELAEVVRAQYTDTPEEEDIRGGAMLGKQREMSRRLAQREADVTEFEETHMIRLTRGKKEKKEKKRVMRQEMSNLGAIADFGNVVAGVEDAFGDGTRDRRGGEVEESGKFKTKGMRKRKVEVFEPEMRRKGKSRSPKGSSGKSKRRK